MAVTHSMGLLQIESVRMRRRENWQGKKRHGSNERLKFSLRGVVVWCLGGAIGGSVETVVVSNFNNTGRKHGRYARFELVVTHV